MSVISHTNCVHTAWVQKHTVCTSVLMNGQQGDWFSSIWSWSEEVSPLSQDQAPFQSQPYPQPHQIYTCAQTCSTKCPMTDRKQTTNSTIVRLAKRLFQNNWIFSISILFSKALFILYRFFFFQRNPKFIAYPSGNLSNCLQKRTGLASSDQKRDVLQKPRKAVKVSNKEWQMPDLGTEIAKNRG